MRIVIHDDGEDEEERDASWQSIVQKQVVVDVI